MRKILVSASAAVILISVTTAPSLSQTTSIIGQIEVVGRSELSGVTVWVDSVLVTETYSTGYYRLDVSSGTYTVRAWAENCLAKIIGTVIVEDRDVLGVDGELFVGDLYPDGIIDLHDLRRLLDHYMDTPDSSGWDEGCDILTDGIIDSLDIDLLSSRWKESSDSRLPDWPDLPLEIIDPDETTIWNIGQENLAVRWTSEYLHGKVSIDLYRWGLEVATLAVSTDNDREFVVLKLPAGLEAGEGYQVQVFLSEESQDLSDEFTIEDPLQIYSPDSETTWFLGEHNVLIEWHPGYETGDVAIFLMTWDTIVDTIAAATANDGRFGDYDVPLSVAAGGGYRVKIVTATGHEAETDNFGIRQMLTVYAPDSTDVWRPGAGLGHVQWWNRAGSTSPVIVYLYKGEELRYTIVEGRPYDEEFYHWPVPSDIEVGGDYRVMARYDDSPEIFDFSDYFAIRPVFKVLRPNSGTSWFMGDKGVAIEWEDAGLSGDVEIKLYQGTGWVDIITATTENDGLYVDYNYRVPATLAPGDDFSVRVFHSVENHDFSNDFEIVQPPAQANLGWNAINSTSTLLDVSMGGSDVTAAAGEWGEVIWTTDGGYTWAEQESGTYRTLYGISVSGDLAGTAVGMDGLIIQTTDGGQNWERRRPDIAKTLYDVSQTDGSTAIGVGDDGMVIRTIDGGATWDVLPSGVTDRLHAVHFIDADNGWAGGRNGTIIRTLDGGDTWTVMDIVDDWVVMDIDFHDIDNGAITISRGTEWGYNHRSVMVTRDGGSSWPYGRLLGPGWGLYSAVAFANSSTLTAIVASEHGDPDEIFEYMYRSIDGGETWVEQSEDLFEHPYGIDYFPGGRGYVVGSSGSVLRTDNSGSAWSPVRPGITDIMGIDHVDSLTAVLVGSHGTIMRTTDRGINWIWVESNTNSDLMSVSFAPEGRGIAAGADRAIVWTFDDGLSWVSTYPSLVPSTVHDAVIVNYPAAIAVGTGGAIARTADGGVVWTRVTSGTSVNLRAVSFVDIDSGTIVGNGGTILGTSDGGINWTPRSSGTSEDLLDIDFVDTMNGMAVGLSGTILRTADGGGTWTTLSSGTSVSLVSVEYFYPYGVTAVGEDGTILRTTDAGNSWHVQPGGTTRTLTGISSGWVMDGIIVGDMGTILRTTTGGE